MSFRPRWLVSTKPKHRGGERPDEEDGFGCEAEMFHVKHSPRADAFSGTFDVAAAVRMTRMVWLRA